MSTNSEFRSYPFILKSLEDLGWNVRSPLKHHDGQVFTQNESLHDPILKPLLEGGKPENLVKVAENIYWAIEAKAEHRDLQKAIQEAQIDYAAKINTSKKIKCLFATGVAGHENNTFLVETYFFDGISWKRVQINSVDTTGFISQEQARKIVDLNDPNLQDQEIPEELFIEKANGINQILHDGAINKRNRARVIASLLLALANDEYLPISDDPTTLIADINSRVRSLLNKYGKENFAQEVAISLPTSRDNHRKNRRALVDCIQELRSINIKSAINSGSDLLGQFYEIFLKYANDAKEIGIVLTPRHITRFSAEALNITDKDYILDPTCGTGGFLVAALDRVKKSSPSHIDTFKKSHIYGIEQDPEVVGLALVNMIFRGDGNSNIYEGNTFDNLFFKEGQIHTRIKQKEYERLMAAGNNPERFITRTLMNPPFALVDPEYKFVDHALSQMSDGGLLLAVLPVSTMSSTSDGRGEITWRNNLLKRHTLKAVIKLSEDLFLPNAHKGTYIVIIEAWKPHSDEKVFWAIMDDGFTMKKSKRLPSSNIPSNMDKILEELKAFLILNKAPEEIEKVIGYKKIDRNDQSVDCGVEAYLDEKIERNIDIDSTTQNLFNILLHQKRPAKISLAPGSFKLVNMADVLENITRGDCLPLNQLKPGTIPVVTTTEENNGIGGFHSINQAAMFENTITIPANGSKYRAFYHPYKFSAVADILVCSLKPEFASIEAKLFICSVINQSSWRFSYFRKCNEQKISKDIQIALPIKDGKLDLQFIRKSLETSPAYQGLKDILSQ
ncbi:MAG: N-6 DNA methylase [Patescibacteria group bacterium]|jgi:type I restriction-modification system DNA methylase subunit